MVLLRYVPFLLLVFLIPAAAQSPAASSPSPPSGQLIDVGGYRVHLYCAGEGTPAVIVVGGGFSFDWALVQPDVTRFTKICTYDPSGTAWSDPGPVLTCRTRISEVRRLLIAARIEGPYVLVGFSFGALVARLYAHEFPGDVAGMVIVDHAFTPSIDPPPVKSDMPPLASGDTPPVLIYKTPIILTTEETSGFSKFPILVQQLHRWASSRNSAPAAAETAEDCLSQLKVADSGPRPLGEMPLVVVSTRNDARGYAELQAEILSLSNNSKQMVAERSFHSVQIDQPEIVIGAIRQVVEAVKKTTWR